MKFAVGNQTKGIAFNIYSSSQWKGYEMFALQLVKVVYRVSRGLGNFWRLWRERDTLIGVVRKWLQVLLLLTTLELIWIDLLIHNPLFTVTTRPNTSVTEWYTALDLPCPLFIASWVRNLRPTNARCNLNVVRYDSMRHSASRARGQLSKLSC